MRTIKVNWKTVLVALVLLVLAGSIGWYADERLNHDVNGYRLEKYGHNVTVGQVNGNPAIYYRDLHIETILFGDSLYVNLFGHNNNLSIDCVDAKTGKREELLVVGVVSMKPVQ